MRLATKAFMSTVSGMVLLMSYHGAGEATTVASAATTSTDDGTTSGGTTTPSDSATSGSDDAAGSEDSATSDDDDSSSSPTSSASASAKSSSSSSSTSSSSSSSSKTSGTFTGDAVMTRWGVVQVEITVENGKITKSEAVQYPTDNPRDQEINAYAVPTLNAEAVQAQSASIDAVSGATVTSGGYVQSLQSAIDQAHL